jgi:hypothetical protein
VSGEQPSRRGFLVPIRVMPEERRRLTIVTVPTPREEFEALTPRQQRRVVEILGPDMSTGWIPKDSDLRAVIALVLKEGEETGGQ